MAAKTAANAGVKCDAAGAGRDAGGAARIAPGALEPVTAPAALAAGAVAGVPQPTQNFAPEISGVAHCGQNRIVVTYARPRHGRAVVLLRRGARSAGPQSGLALLA